MDLELNTVLIVGLCVATAGLTLNQVFRHFDRSCLLMFAGTRMRLVRARILVWLAAVAISLIVWMVLAALLPGTIALAVFFGFEAVILDVCTQRIQYVDSNRLTSYHEQQNARYVINSVH